MGLFPVVNGCLYVLFLKSLYPEARKTSDTSGHYLCYELRYVRRLWKHFSDNAPCFQRSHRVISSARGSCYRWLSSCLIHRSSLYASALRNIVFTHMSMATASSFSGISTVTAVFTGVIILSEPFGFHEFFGIALVLLGIWGVNALHHKNGRFSFSHHSPLFHLTLVRGETFYQ